MASSSPQLSDGAWPPLPPSHGKGSSASAALRRSLGEWKGRRGSSSNGATGTKANAGPEAPLQPTGENEPPPSSPPRMAPLSPHRTGGLAEMRVSWREVGKRMNRETSSFAKEMLTCRILFLRFSHSLSLQLNVTSSNHAGTDSSQRSTGNQGGECEKEKKKEKKRADNKVEKSKRAIPTVIFLDALSLTFFFLPSQKNYSRLPPRRSTRRRLRRHRGCSRPRDRGPPRREDVAPPPSRRPSRRGRSSSPRSRRRRRPPPRPSLASNNSKSVPSPPRRPPPWKPPSGTRKSPARRRPRPGRSWRRCSAGRAAACRCSEEEWEEQEGQRRRRAKAEAPHPTRPRPSPRLPPSSWPRQTLLPRP